MKIQIVILFLSLSTLVSAQENLIKNPGCELPLVNGKIPNWVEVVGNEWTKRTTDPRPKEGQGYFFAGNTADAELNQTIALDDYSCSIDLGNQRFFFIGSVMSTAKNPPDQTTINIDVLDAGDVVLGSYKLGPYNYATWTPVTYSFIAPVKTRKIKIRLRSTRQSGTTNDAYFDDLALAATPEGKNFTIASTTALPASCGRTDGVLSVSIAAGPQIASRQYSIDGQIFQPSPTFINLASKNYTVTVKDGGCVQSQTATVGTKNPPKLDRVNSASASCGRADGAISLTLASGSGASQYALNSQPFQITPVFFNLVGGKYKVTVKDGDCIVSDSITVGNKSLPRIDDVKITDASCNQPDGTVTLVVTGGSGAGQYSLNGQTYQLTPVFINLASGDYKATVKDGACLVDRSVKVGLKKLTFNTFQIKDATCNQANGSITASVQGGNGTKTYSLNGKASQSSPAFQNLAGGNYTITVTDGGCTASQTATVGAKSAPTIDGMQTSESTCGQQDGTLILTVSGGSGNRQYSLNGQTYQSSTTFQNLAVGSYTVTVRDAANCTVKREVSISASGDCYVFVPDAFTPNRDGVNDFFQLVSGYKINYTIRNLAIYNRWGEVMFSRENFSILEKDGWWDGTSQGVVADAGAYTYYFEYVDINNVTISRRGVVTLLR
ncbi:gliding motility-associated C-terminal domain-containing protein [Spirosoma sp. BT702]|uniref:Gliding motility-associated C-terminal domain-containing protein n=1 Tax=Spirosoma profusum TaxID=2771354 RepID=A0A926XZN6_9BACT|nr:gliding motility-associated C-terminal domain-containing protein [Spirosoma profusum]MBD2703762.1 gliding motility-associated C-terminal domain-containing protein [Spirosoma profusum]